MDDKTRDALERDALATKKQSEIVDRAQQVMDHMFPGATLSSRQLFCITRAFAEQLIDLEARIKQLEDSDG